MNPWMFTILVLLLGGSIVMNGWRIMEERETQIVCESSASSFVAENPKAPAAEGRGDPFTDI